MGLLPLVKVIDSLVDVAHGKSPSTEIQYAISHIRRGGQRKGIDRSSLQRPYNVEEGKNQDGYL